MGALDHTEKKFPEGGAKYSYIVVPFQVTVGSEKGTGSGPNKKLAKRAAAENVLLAMGYAKPAGPQPAKSAIKSGGGEQDEDDGEGGAPDKGKKVRIHPMSRKSMIELRDAFL